MILSKEYLEEYGEVENYEGKIIEIHNIDEDDDVNDFIKETGEEAIKIKRTQVMTPEHARAVTELLTTSVNRSKSVIKSEHYNIAAKTGTSIKPKENGAGYTNKLYTSIVGYLPASDPQVLIYVIVDSAQGGEIWGNTVAAPIFKEISTQVTHILNLQPDKI